MSSLTLFSRCPMPSGRSERASVITFSVLARKSESGAVSCSVLTGFGFFFPAAFEVLERNLLVLTGPKEHGDLRCSTLSGRSERAPVLARKSVSGAASCPTLQEVVLWDRSRPRDF